MRVLVLVTSLGLAVGASASVEAQGTDMTRYQRAAVRALERERAADLLNQAMKGKRPIEVQPS
jgi:hypothetical protein